MTVDFRIQPRTDDASRGYLIAKCTVSTEGECRWPLWSHPAQGTVWQWDGNVQNPTIRPSIACNGGCGRHFTITKGNVT